MKKIPFCKAAIGLKEKLAVWRVMSSGWLTSGDKVREFEKKFAEFIGSKYAVAVNSCTSALFLCLKRLNLPLGSHIAVPSLTFTATINEIINAGYLPHFIDVRLDNLTMNKNYVDEKKVQAILPVHLTGNIADANYNLPIVEDAAHLCLPNSFSGNNTCYSFYATKNLTTGEGGMIATNSEEDYQWFKKAIHHGLTKTGEQRNKEGSPFYDVEFVGWKMNMSDIMAAIGLTQLKKINWINKERQRCVGRYNYRLGYQNTGLHLYPIYVMKRHEFIKEMKDLGIQCSVHFLPIHKMTAYEKYNKVKLPITEFVGQSIVSLPLYPELSNKQIDYICQQILKTKKMIINEQT